MKDIMIQDRYRVEQMIGHGGFGMVYSAIDTRTSDKVAVKLIHVSDEDCTMLDREAAIGRVVAGGTGMPEVLWHGVESEYHIMISSLLGPSLEDLFIYCNGRFSLKTVLLIADQALARIQHFHNKGMLHRDIKPENFLMGTGKNGNVLYLIDYGCTKTYAEATEDKRNRVKPPFLGTPLYASNRNHTYREQSKSDDLESLGYMLIWLYTGKLPWKENTGLERDEVKVVGQMKSSTSPEVLCAECPAEFITYMKYVKSLRFSEKPNYPYLRRLFQRAFRNEGFVYDHVFDWTAKMYANLTNTSPRSY